jgi:tight adherence protein C
LIGLGAGPDIGVGVFAVLFAAGILYFTEKELNEKIKKRRMQMQMDFPDFLNKLTLLINAGLTVSRAWEKIVLDNTKDTPLYNELALTLSEIRGGLPELQAYINFSKRCRTPEINKFVGVIEQNLRKGGSETAATLKYQAKECWELRKNAAKRLGEEAGTKMLLPMMIMFLAILLIVATPAILAMRGI